MRRYLVTVYGLSFMSPKSAGEEWQDKLAALITWLSAAFISITEGDTGPDGVHVFLPQDLFRALSSTIVIRVEPMDGQPLTAEGEGQVQERLVGNMLLFCQENDLPVPPGHVEVLFVPTHQ